MKSLFQLCLIILFNTTTLFAQEFRVDTILIKRHIGNGNYQATTHTGTFRLDDVGSSLYKGMPIGNDTSQLSFIPFDIEQYYYDRLKRGIISYAEVLKRFNNNIDTNLLSKDFIKHRIGVYCGLKGNVKIVIVDANNNLDFSDDRVYHYDTTYYFNQNEKEALDNAPILDLKSLVFKRFCF